MIVTFVSQCEKHALKRTRRVLDAFANRIGDNTWQTLITAEGLQTVKKMLRQSASRSTAVSCHWIRSRSRTQLLWVVGNKKKFNAEGYVPVNRTEKSFLGSEHENDWKYLSLIGAFARLAALLHDWGKASRLFQDKLNPAIKSPFKGDPLRHEWISALLFSSLVKSQSAADSDEKWLEIIANQQWNEPQLQQWTKENGLLSAPLSGLPDAASLLIWLIVSHHRLPFLNKKENRDNYCDQARNSLANLLKTIEQKWGYENRQDEDEFKKRLGMCFEFPNGLLSESMTWSHAVQQAAIDLKHQLPLFQEAMNEGSWRIIAHYARLCLMLGDHNYSSKDNDPQWKSDIPLYANTKRYFGLMQFKQKLDEHLVNVAEIARNVAETLPFFESEPPTASDIPDLTHDKNSQGKFSWQEDAVNTLYKYREEHEDGVKGYFIVNMASTGCGKTLANAKIMQALSEDKQSLRYILALGLRTLTLQTGDEYRDRIGLDDSQLAVLVGSKAVTQLHLDSKQKQEDISAESTPEASGSASQESLFDDDELHWPEDKWQGILPEESLSTVLTRAKDRALLYAPVLACTIDHMMGATETIRGGRYILPCLRLMSSDLVIDEVDDFTDHDSIAIGRLVHMAGLLGRKVMISSATIPPDLALAYFHAYQAGWHVHAKSRQQSAQIGCIWVDEGKYDAVKDKCKSTTHTATIIANEANAPSLYQQYHDAFIDKRAKILQAQPARRKACIVPMSLDKGQNSQPHFFEHIQQAILAQHSAHSFIDSQTGIHISFGVVRMANIRPCVELTHFLLACEWPENVEIRTMAYHSQQVLLLRHEQEKHLDSVLKRKEKNGELPVALENSIIRGHLEQVKNEGKANNLIFILVATPVEEVGRDHDFDWAVVEPSSYRSIIQMAGRVRRHREGAVEHPNMALLQYNWKGFQEGGKEVTKDVFRWPGYENENLSLRLVTHNLSALVDEQQLLQSVDSIPRITKQLDYESRKHRDLACLEHAAIKKTLATGAVFAAKTEVKQNNSSRRSNQPKPPLPTNTAFHLWGYTHGCWWMTGLPQQLTPFRHSTPSIRLSLVINNNGKLEFSQYQQDQWIFIESKYGIKHQPFEPVLTKRLWLFRDYEQSINSFEQADLQVISLSRLYGEISLQLRDKQDVEYHYNDQMGIYVVKR
ncbi:type I-F CRISPR-associated helicase Cas3f [Providencia burhodogranariea]|uniref:CRISPR-associated helicase Cas3 family n=1 Tax=Providencia burhodogranariea DSM 19968 TaxID=1141662 RepID=K8WNP2_9GAMM|nr:type I-F CRISPR-associated helicase Cas3f [Providencia burhodogranariea]EKT62228.1 CRISPR-associated helicase Cas3 family [Providencia burhodogranariea DSM 19968]